MHPRSLLAPIRSAVSARRQPGRVGRLRWLLSLLLVAGALLPAAPVHGEDPSPRIWLPIVLGGQPAPAPAGQTILDAITEDEAAGRINAETAALYRLEAMLGAPELPAAYASAPGGMPPIDGSALVGDILAAWQSFSPEGRRALAPYLMRPNDPASRYRQGPPATFAASEASGSATAADPLQRPVEVVQVGTAAKGRILVWGTDAGNPTALAVLNQLGTGAADNVLGPIEQLFGRTWSGDTGDTSLWCDSSINILCHEGDNLDDRLDVYVVPLSQPGDTRGNNSAPTASFVVIDENNTSEAREFAVWHELTHVIQFQFPIKQSWGSVKWWMEASANWSAAHFAPANRFPYDRHAQSLLDRPDEPIDLWSDRSADQLHAYGAFLWPMVFDRIAAAGTGLAVREVWALMAIGKTPLAAIKEVVGSDFEYAWREFVLANWNRDYARRDGGSDAGYADYAPLLDPGAGVPADVVYEVGYDATGSSYRRSQEFKPQIGHMAAAYVHATITPQTSQLLFLLDDWTKQEGATMDVFMRKQGEAWNSLDRKSLDDWKSPDTGTRNWRYLCRDMKDDRAEELLIVLSNAKISGGLSATIPVAISNVGCRWQGTVSVDHREAYSFPSQESEWSGSDEYTGRITGTWSGQMNPLDVCDDYPDGLYGCPPVDPAFPHLMPIETWSSHPTVEASGRSDQIEGGDCVTGQQYQFSGPFNGSSRMTIWGAKFNQVGLDFHYGLPSGVSYQPLPGCTDVDDPGEVYFQFGVPIEPLGMPRHELASCVDRQRTVSADGSTIRATWTIDTKGGLGQSSCGNVVEPGTGYEQWSYYEQVAVNLQRAPEP